jgi:hypothetical protein
MANITRNFTSGRMNKVIDERLVPNGEYIDAMNIRMGSTEQSEVGVIENTKGNTALTLLCYTDGTPLSVSARCIGAVADSANELVYWFVHDPDFVASPTGKLDMIVSFNVFTNILTYHIISTDNGNGINTTLNFNPKYTITGVNIIEDLLFFTDDYNAPRVINTKKNYSNPVAFIDQFDPESILVIKKPPVTSPTIEPILTAGQENYIVERFLSFAYRYRYADGEYSATSQWSTIAFVPNPFQFSINSFLNEGMTNFFNAVKITYNSGGPLVVGIDLLFKQSNNNIIKVIEKLDKADMGIADNINYTYVFTNSKIFTVLPESELLRLYDNVPRFAKAQTIMGNRLMYGNYVEGYDMIDKNGQPVKLDYYTNLINEVIGDQSLTTTTSSGNYTVSGPVTIPNSVVNIDFSGVNLIEGAFFSLEVTLNHAYFTIPIGSPLVPSETTTNVNLTFSFFLNQSYSSVYEMSVSTQFQNAIGTIFNVLPVYNPSPGGQSSCDGVTFTDQFNCSIPNTLSASPTSVTKIASSISPYSVLFNAGILIVSNPGSDVISLQFPAMKFVDDLNTPTTHLWEYYSITDSEATFQKIATPKSLHSNRDYEIGIVYMDEFLRSTTALVSPNNTEHVPCRDSDTKNSIRVTIPTTQIAPEWARRYKFVIKPSATNYEVIYSSIFFKSPTDNNVYFLLEGENARKVEKGDRLIVKADTNGPTNTCVYATVLEKESKAEAFITPPGNITVPGGVYMKINPNSFATTQDANSIISPGTITTSETTGGDFVLQYYPMNIEDPANPGMYIDYDVPAGSIIKLSFQFLREGTGDGNRKCEKRNYTLQKTLIASANYGDMKAWWDGDNVASILDNGTEDVGLGGCSIDNQYIPALAGSNVDIPQNLCINYYRFYRNISNNELVLMLRGTESCTGVTGGNKRKSTIITDIQVFRATSVLIFETEPTEASPDIFFENDLSFEIDEDGQHMGNVQDQDFGTNTPAIIDTGFFNCFSFGNGAESFKIRDSILGVSFGLGERVTAVSAQDYKEADRFSDITYSGIYNTESNVNKLNEFNLGLLNFKNLEASFGEIYILDGRETDVLALQEDKISYVLAGKNLLSDAAAGGAITSVPEVLGTQIARTEKYGISFNPESYVQWGYDRYFTDAKRGVVLQLKGDSYSNEQISIVSDNNMRTWFRDLFNSSFGTQKLGGFDPYMNEYVLSSNDQALPVNEQCLSCSVSQTFTLSILNEDIKSFDYCVDLGALVGYVSVTYNIISIEAGADIIITASFNGNDYDSGLINTSGSFTFNKDVNYVDVCNINIQYTGDVVVDVNVSCPDPETLRIVEVVVTDNDEAGETMHAEYRYVSGTYTSPLQSNLVTYTSGTSTPLISRYNITTGYAGSGGFPPQGATMTIQYSKILFDSRPFNPTTDKLKYLRTSTLYNNNSTEMSALIAASSLATPVNGSGNTYYADFTVPPSIDGDYLYLIWDLRKSIPIKLCFSKGALNDINEVCCECTDCAVEECRTIEVTAQGSDTTIEFTNGLCGETEPYELFLTIGDSATVCVNYDYDFTIISGNPIIKVLSCNCAGCIDSCNTWSFENTGAGEAAVEYTMCGGVSTIEKIPIGTTIDRCVEGGTTPSIVGGTVTMSYVCGCGT